MFLRSRNKENKSVINTEYIVSVEEKIYQEGNGYFFVEFKMLANSIVRFEHDSEESMNKEFEWITEKLEVVQNVPETVIDKVATVTIKNFAMSIPESTVKNVVNKAAKCNGDNIVFLLYPSDYHHLHNVKFDQFTTIAEGCIEKCAAVLMKTISFKIIKQ